MRIYCEDLSKILIAMEIAGKNTYYSPNNKFIVLSDGYNSEKKYFLLNRETKKAINIVDECELKQVIRKKFVEEKIEKDVVTQLFRARKLIGVVKRLLSQLTENFDELEDDKYFEC